MEQHKQYHYTSNFKAISVHPEITGNDYHVIGTLDRPEWRKGIQDPLSMQEMVEHLHDFKEVVTFQRAYV